MNQTQIIVLPQLTYFVDQNFSLKSRESTSLLTSSFGSGRIKHRISSQNLDYQHSQVQVDSLWQTIEKYYSQHRIDQAKTVCQKYQNSQFLVNPNSKLSPHKYDLIQQIYQEQKLMTLQYQYFDQPGYVLDKEDKGIKMYCRIDEKKKQVAVRVEAELDIPIERFMCIVSEVDLFDQIVPFAFGTRQLRQISRNKKIGTTKVYVPLLSDRQAYFYAAAYDRLTTHNSIFFFSKTISSDYQFQRKLNYPVRLNTDMVELQYKFYIMEYTPLSATRGRVRLATNIDMKLGFLPMFILNKSLRTFSFDYFSNLMKVNRNFEGSEWQKKMKARPYIYNFFKRRIAEYIYQGLN